MAVQWLHGAKENHFLLVEARALLGATGLQVHRMRDEDVLLGFSP